MVLGTILIAGGLVCAAPELAGYWRRLVSRLTRCCRYWRP